MGLTCCALSINRTPGRNTEVELETNLAFWLPAMFFLGLASMVLVYVFIEACDKI